MSDGWVKTERGWRKSYGIQRSPSAARSDLPMPRVISDTMDPTEHVDGRFYDSKSAFRAVTKANGLVEVGNDNIHRKPPEKPKGDPRARREAVQKAVSQVIT